MDNDSIQIIHIRDKHILHVPEGLDWEGPGEIAVHGTCVGIGQCCKAKHILHGTCLMYWEHAVHFGLGSGNCFLQILCGAVFARWWRICPLSVAVEQGKWVQIKVGVRPGMVMSSVLRSSAWSSVAVGGEHKIWWM